MDSILVGISREHIGNILSRNFHDLNREEQEWWNLYISIVCYIRIKYGFLMEIYHNLDRENNSGYKMTDFEFKSAGIEEFPAGFYEMVNICSRNADNGINTYQTEEEIIDIINKQHERKSKKGYIKSGKKLGLIMTTILTNSTIKPLNILMNLKEQNGTFDILVLIGLKNMQGESCIFIYNKEFNLGYEIHINAEKRTIEKRNKITF